MQPKELEGLACRTSPRPWSHRSPHRRLHPRAPGTARPVGLWACGSARRPPGLVEDYEAGRARAGATTLLALTQVLQVEIGYFLRSLAEDAPPPAHVIGARRRQAGRLTVPLCLAQSPRIAPESCSSCSRIWL